MSLCQAAHVKSDRLQLNDTDTGRRRQFNDTITDTVSGSGGLGKWAVGSGQWGLEFGGRYVFIRWIRYLYVYGYLYRYT